MQVHFNAHAIRTASISFYCMHNRACANAANICCVCYSITKSYKYAPGIFSSLHKQATSHGCVRSIAIVYAFLIVRTRQYKHAGRLSLQADNECRCIKAVRGMRTAMLACNNTKTSFSKPGHRVTVVLCTQICAAEQILPNHSAKLAFANT